MTDLQRRMAAGAAWMILFRLTERSIGFISTLILARLLVPDDFGLVAMATSILAALELLGAFSFDMALIQNQAATRKHYDTAWTFEVLFGVIKCALLLALSVPAAAFYGEPRITAVMQVLALCTLLQGFDNIGVVAFQKDLELHKEFRFGLYRKLAGFVVTIALAIALQSYWALLGGMLTLRVTSLALSYGLHPYRPRFSLGAASELFNFSKWLLLNNILIFANNRGADFVIGRLSGARALGIYSVAYEIANLPTTELVWPISRAVFPGYSRLAGNPAELAQTFLQVIGLVALLTVPAGALIGLVAEPFVLLLLGPKWLDAVPLIQVLAMFGIVRSLHGPTGSIYVALGKPIVVAALQSVQLALALSLMVVLVPRLGAVGAAWAILAGAATAMVVNYVLVKRELKLPVVQLLGALVRPLVAATAMAAFVLAISPLVDGGTGPVAAGLRLLVLSAFGLAVYVSCIAVLWFVSGRADGPETRTLAFLRARLHRAA